MARPVRERLVHSTVDLMTRHGVAGTGISELLEHSAASRRSIYLHFPGGKSELVRTATKFAGAQLTEVIESLADRPPAAMISDFVTLWSAQLTATDFSSGCPIVAATLGRHDAPDAAEAAGEVFSGWIDTLTTHLMRHDVEPDEARTVATTVVAAIEGAVVLSLARRSTEPLDRVGRHLAEYVALTTGA